MIKLAFMFSSPTMIMLFIFGVIVGIVFIFAITTAIVQTLRGKFKVNYDEIAAQNSLKDEQRRKGKRGR